jgi:hypothetical protein
MMGEVRPGPEHQFMTHVHQWALPMRLMHETERARLERSPFMHVTHHMLGERREVPFAGLGAGGTPRSEVA